MLSGTQPQHSITCVKGSTHLLGQVHRGSPQKPAPGCSEEKNWASGHTEDIETEDPLRPSECINLTNASFI